MSESRGTDPEHGDDQWAMPPEVRAARAQIADPARHGEFFAYCNRLQQQNPDMFELVLAEPGAKGAYANGSARAASEVSLPFEARFPQEAAKAAYAAITAPRVVHREVYRWLRQVQDQHLDEAFDILFDLNEDVRRDYELGEWLENEWWPHDFGSQDPQLVSERAELTLAMMDSWPQDMAEAAAGDPIMSDALATAKAAQLRAEGSYDSGSALEPPR